MSVKRQATTELNHENWDQEDPSEHEEMGSFKTAAKDVLEKRVIKTAKRRTSGISSDEPKQSIFSGFGGFNKTQPSSFDFLSKLTQGTKTNEASTEESDINTLSKPTSTSGITQGSFFSPTAAPSLSSNNQTSSPKAIFTNSGSTPTTGVFSMKSGSANESPFKIQSNNNDSQAKVGSSPAQPTIFGSSTTNKLFPSNTTSTPINVSSEKTSNISKDKETGISEHQLKYYNKLKTLNQSVSDWIKKHVEATPLCILSPIFKDYDNHLKVVRDEYEKAKQKAKEAVSVKNDQNIVSETTQKNSETSPFATTKTSTFFNSSLKTQTDNDTGTKDNKGVFSFGVKPPTSASVGSTSSFTFGISAGPATSSPFAMTTNSNQNTDKAAPLSFGICKPFSFNTNVQKPAETTEEKEAEDEPPKVEYTPIAEENSVYDKKCKIFVKKDGNFADKGVGTLYVKKIEESGKHQLLVRANTTLGNVLLNFILSSSIPTQRMGKNNVMLVCIPTPDAKPPPTPILIRVKTSEEADELLETLNKYKA